MTYIKYILPLLFILNISLYAQTEVNFSAEIEELNFLSEKIISSETDEEKNLANIKYEALLKKVISNNSSFNYNFSLLKTISILQKNNLKIYNWAIPLTDGTYKYHAFFQIRKSENSFNVVALTDKSENMKVPQYKTLTNKNWFGAFYYKIIFDKKFGKDYYTLLGWDGNNLLTNKKLIDIVNISNSNVVKFGAPLFKADEKKKTKRRVIFEYAENVVMSLKYHEDIKAIVFDKLVPASSNLKGVYEYYGPALEIFDAYLLNKGKWIFKEGIDIKLDPNIKDNFWVDPKENIKNKK